MLSKILCRKDQEMSDEYIDIMIDQMATNNPDLSQFMDLCRTASGAEEIFTLVGGANPKDSPPNPVEKTVGVFPPG